MNQIICVTEFTELTIEAMKTAARFANRWGERVALTHSVDEREQFPYNVRCRLVEQDRPRLAAETQRLQQLGFEFDAVLLRGMPEDGIAGYAWHSRSRLIVAGATPTGVIEHWALG